MKRIVVKRPAEIPRLTVSYKVPGLISSVGPEPEVEKWEPYALEMLSGILSGGDSARFASRLIRGQEIADSVNSGYQLSGRLDGLFTITGTPAQGKTVEELETAIMEQLQDLKNNRVAEEELQRVKAQVVSSDVYEKDSAFYQGLILGIFETTGLGWQMADEYVDQVSAITAEQVQAVARKYLVENTTTVAVLEPAALGREKPGLPMEQPGGAGDNE
jgi:zinc protease